jgi:hypothetical protein
VNDFNTFLNSYKKEVCTVPVQQYKKEVRAVRVQQYKKGQM